jgi:hypothetical protein
MFGLNQWNELSVVDLDNSAGQVNFPVVGLEGESQQIQMAVGHGNGATAPSCSISVTPDGACPVVCTVGDYSVNSWSGADNVWALRAGGTPDFTIYAYNSEEGWEILMAAAIAAAAKNGKIHTVSDRLASGG